MDKKLKLWLTAGTFLIVLGCVLFAVAMTVLQWDFGKLSTAEFETNTYTVTEAFSDLVINTDTADILFALSQDGNCTIVCYEDARTPHSVDVQNETLTVTVFNSKKPLDYIGIDFETPSVTIYLPETEYNSLRITESTGDIRIPQSFRFADIDISTSTGDVDCRAFAAETIKIKANTGRIHVEELSAETLELSVSTGNVTASSITCQGDITISVSTGKADLTGIRCRNLTTTGSTGNIVLKDVIASQAFSVERSTGDVQFRGCDAAEIYVRTGTGDVTGTLLTQKIFLTETSTGTIDVPGSVSGGTCRISTNTGDIILNIA